MPQREKLRHRSVDVDVAVSRGLSFAGDGICEQCGPDPVAGDCVDGEVMVVLEHHHCATGDRVRPTGLPERLELVRDVWVPPSKVAGGRFDGCGELLRIVGCTPACVGAQSSGR